MLWPVAFALRVAAQMAAEAFCITADSWLSSAAPQPAWGEGWRSSCHPGPGQSPSVPLRGDTALCLQVLWALQWSQQGAPCSTGSELPCDSYVSLQHRWLSGAGETPQTLDIPLPSSLHLSLYHQRTVEAINKSRVLWASNLESPV